MWEAFEVEDLPCLAIVDTGPRASLISCHMVSVVDKPVNPHPHRLLEPMGKVMPFASKIIAEVTLGKQESTDNFFSSWQVVATDVGWSKLLVRL